MVITQGDRRMEILHVFADMGAEDPTLDRYGDVLRVSIDPRPNEWSETVKADANDLPFRDNTMFDIGWFHPPCGGVSPMSDTGNGNREDWPDLVPLAREIARKHTKHYVIENKPRDSLDAEVILTGHMFNLDIEYKRAFETNFPVEQPRDQDKLADTSPFYYTEKPHGWWAGVKGSSMKFSKEHLAKNTIPAAYIDYIMRHYHEAVNDEELSDYTDYDKRMDVERSMKKNAQLTGF